MSKEPEQQKYESELVVSSKGHYIYHCSCGATTGGTLDEIRITDPFVYCGMNGISGCTKALNLRKIAERDDWIGVRVRKQLKLD